LLDMHVQSSGRDRSLISRARGYPQIIVLILACSLVLATVVVLGLVGGGKNEPLEPVLLATGEWAPYSGEALASYGVASAVVSAVFQQMGYQPQLRFMPWPRAEQVTAENDTNRGVRAAFPYVFTSERDAKFYYSKSILTIELSIFYNVERNSNAGNIKEVGDLAKFLIVPIRGYQYPAEVEKFVGGVPAVENNIAAFEQLLNSEQPLLVVEATRVGEEILSGQLAIKADPIRTSKLHFLKETPIFLIASKRNPNNSSLIRKFDNTLIQMQGTGSLKQIEAQVFDAIDAQRMVRLQPLQPQGRIEAFLTAGGSVLLPQGTRAVVEHWSSNYLKDKPARADAAEFVRVRVLNGPQRGRSLYVDERTIVLP
jgi:polar amino acid transport system substrate-binding protein